MKSTDEGLGKQVRIDACSLCQLKCPVCTEIWNTREHVGSGYLKFEDFTRFVDRYPNYSRIELSNSGEIFLNPDLSKIIEYAHRAGIVLTAEAGVNLNTINEEMIENLVQYDFHHLSVSIDGASEETYRIYRVGGSFSRVMANIEKINSYKKRHNKDLPKLTWKFIVFGHNELDIPKARRMAEDLGMKFYLAYNSNPEYSPIKDNEFVRKYMDCISKDEWGWKNKRNWQQWICHYMWDAPQINWDGRLLGCSCNLQGVYGNVFRSSLKECLENEKYIYAKKMLMGLAEDRKDIPCHICSTYKDMVARKDFLNRDGMQECIDPTMLRSDALSR